METKAETKAGIIYTRMSDHFPYFVSIKYRNYKKESMRRMTKVQINTNEAKQNMLHELLQGEIEKRLDRRATANPNTNYDVMHNYLIEVENKYFPYREVKFNKHVH